jgi:hypothetical protein
MGWRDLAHDTALARQVGTSGVLETRFELTDLPRQIARDALARLSRSPRQNDAPGRP